MTTFTNSPRLIKGDIVLIDTATAVVVMQRTFTLAVYGEPSR